jgi:predicted ATPase
MKFYVRKEYPHLYARRNLQSGDVVLVHDDWDDWFQYSTMYTLYIVNESNNLNKVGSVKIGQYNMITNQRRPDLPKTFAELNIDQFFSIGQDEEYYQNLNSFGDDKRDEILRRLNDLAKDISTLERAMKERVTGYSLLRYVSPATVKGQFHRLADGGTRLSRFDFTYHAPAIRRGEKPQFSLSFHVEPESNPPTNIHVLIGRNGVGKTHILNNMINSLVSETARKTRVGFFETGDSNYEVSQEMFAGLVSVTFSAFDNLDPLPEKRDKSLGLKYYYIGLKRPRQNDNTKSRLPKSTLMLQTEFVNSVYACIAAGKTSRWRRAIEMLEVDPIFNEADITSLSSIRNKEVFDTQAGDIFNKLSSGHKIVLLTITRLIETVEERTLVLLDEPEAHLHPPLLSAFIRALSDLLILRNGVAIIATHSPVVLQEVPRSCVWKLRRVGTEASAEKLETESFGENVGSLTRQVFGLEVTHAGFHKMLIDAVNNFDSYEQILEYFNNELGAEAKGIVRALFLNKNRPQ